MPFSISQRLLAVLRRGDVLPSPGPVAAGGRSPRGRAAVAELAAAVPGLAEERAERARTAGLLVGWVAVVTVPLWAVVDLATESSNAGTFLAVRLLCEIPMLLALVALGRLPLGRRRPELLTFSVLAVVQAEVAWMVTRSEDPRYHLLGLTLAIYGSGCVMVARPRWTVALVAVSWAALGLASVSADDGLSPGDLLAVTVYLATASVIAVLAHLRRYALDTRELHTRVRLEREQQRTGALLAQLERLSHEDPLTGLANRRRWDAELAELCTRTRQRGDVLSVVLVDLDHFKDVNDRYGHAGGDAALRTVAGLLSARVRGGDLVARLGGDELAVLMPGADAERATAVAEELRREARLLRPPGLGAARLSLSLGVATATGADAYPRELMSRADEQLYRAKTTRNAVGAGPVPPGTPEPRPEPQPAG
ncbi:GGDEF domain-containing protein [Blastococcus sp. MG754426]|uniref:GGDEF domain-containing protein n=1 Tax=unclassified Blastococcus TaxID=2619396 RepID=UPI001EF06CA7|nr:MULTISPECIES: GGDEF domain-containing protein [unclassified Blastococcus]MCF6509794.1 GGDEF domain-containing protein [Blastococcus sp. MG754426]MCF6514169.1 GGDEF domain-containing protein [Blastococcus sp. MG754427]